MAGVKEKGKEKGKKKNRNSSLVPVPLAEASLLGPDEDACFREGAIRRLVLHNFLTFDNVVLEPSPQLNLIVGPNGTGKSSLVCAICLVLCGHTSILGRAKELKDFVKNGPAKEGYVEITLQHSSGNHPTIRRHIFKDRNNSRWLVNGTDRREQEVKEIVKSMNIQLENKCQFLPQDKVVEFAKLDCYQLLEETEKAIGTDDMYSLHQQLKGTKDKRVELERSLQNKNKELEEKERQNQLLERDVRRKETREKSLKTIKHLKMKKVWIDYEEARQRYEQAKEKRKEVEKLHRRLHERHGPLKEKMKQREAIVQKFEDNIKKIDKELKDMKGLIEKNDSKSTESSEEQKNLVQNYDQLKKEAAEQEDKIRSFKSQISSLKSNLESLPRPETIEPQVRQKTREITLLSQEFGQLQTAQSEIMEKKGNCELTIKRCNDELAAINDVYRQRLDMLSRKDNDAYQAVMWLKENMDKFRRPVYEPILTLFRIKNVRYANQIESFFGGRDLVSFVFESRDDRETFAREVRDRMNLKVNMVIAPTTPLSNYKCSIPMETLKQCGFQYMLIDLVEAPPPVLAYYCAHQHLHNIPVTLNRLTSQQLNSFKSSYPDIQRFYTSDQMYLVKRSRYRTESITRSEQIRQCQYFLKSTADDITKASILADIEKAKNDLRGFDVELKKLHDKELLLRQQDKTLRDDKKALRDQQSSYRTLTSSIEQKEIRLRQLEENPIDLETEFQKFKGNIIRCANSRKEILEKLSIHVKVYKDTLQTKVKTHFNLMDSKRKREEFERECHEVKNKLDESFLTVNQAKDSEKSFKEIAHSLMDKAKEVSGVSAPDRLPQEVTDVFNNFPDTSAELEDSIHEHQTQVQMHSSSLADEEAATRQYEANDARIKELREQIDKEDEAYSNHEQNIEQLKRRWLEPLTEMISNISGKFSKFFQDMNCVGEVDLLQDDTDFKKYGVQIRVKFRHEESLHVLDARHQSGGERSVSTMLYLMALQDITNCPFRVVDEINQGMDSTNERGVFNQIVRTVNRKDTPQYFVLTPKLLQSLHYSSAVTVHVIHNGLHIPSDVWDKKCFV